MKVFIKGIFAVLLLALALTGCAGSFSVRDTDRGVSGFVTTERNTVFMPPGDSASPYAPYYRPHD